MPLVPLTPSNWLRRALKSPTRYIASNSFFEFVVETSCICGSHDILTSDTWLTDAARGVQGFGQFAGGTSAQEVCPERHQG